MARNGQRISGGELEEYLVGKSIVTVNNETGRMVLSDGAIVSFDRSNDDCCSYIELSKLTGTSSVITRAEFRDNEDQTGGEGEYYAWLWVLTEGQEEIRIAEAEGNASNGYYLHGFALGIRIDRVLEDAIREVNQDKKVM